MKNPEEKASIETLKIMLFWRILFYAAIAALAIIFLTKFFMPKKSSYSPQKNLFEKRIIYRNI